jgi:hypothetical protein
MNTLEVVALASRMEIEQRYHVEMCVMLMLAAGIDSHLIRDSVGVSYTGM